MTTTTNAPRFTLQRDRWYAWQMLPGYVGGLGTCEPYHSPIRVKDVEPLGTGGGKLRIGIYNAFYAEGVRDIDVTLRVIVREADYLVARIVGQSDRTAIIHDLSTGWIEMVMPLVAQEAPPLAGDAGTAAALQLYLDRSHATGRL